MERTRVEKDYLGERKLPENALWGIHTLRAMENFKVSGKSVPKKLIQAYGAVKCACAKTNFNKGYLKEDNAKAIIEACEEMMAGQLNDHIVVDALQGGAGTSTNMNVSEVIANKALEKMQLNKGDYSACDPLLHVNLHQSTNDTYPTALRVAAYHLLKELEQSIVALHQQFEKKEKQFSSIAKVGRTELMDAVPMTAGRMFSAWSDALSRDRWRVFKCTERIRVINLGGTAIGTGLGAPRDYIFAVTDELRHITGLPLARAENLVDGTQNQDVFVEVMGIVKAHAMTLHKIGNDLRLLNMGPDGGIGEVRLPDLQAGSSIMPGKINPVIPEMMAQVAMHIAGSDQTITWAVGSGQLELNAFLPLIAYHLIDVLEMLIRTNQLVAEKAIANIEIDQARCSHALQTSRAMVTILVPGMGYHKAQEVAAFMKKENCDLIEAARHVAGWNKEKIEALLKPEALNALGFTREEEHDDKQW